MTDMPETKKTTKLAITCYGLGDLASQFVWTFVGSYLTIYYTDVVGFAPATVAIIMLIARIWDAINDPLMGSIAENTRRSSAANKRFRSCFSEWELGF